MLSLRLRPVREKEPFVSWWCSSWTQCLVVLLATQFVCQETNAQTGETATQSIRSSEIKSACWNSARYTLDNQTVTWQLASTHCMSFAIGQLVVITSAAEQMFITNTFVEGEPWIGLRDLNRDRKWVDGTQFRRGSYENFDGGRGELSRDMCVFLQTNPQRQWGDTDCSEQRSFLCEEQDVPGPNTWQSCNGAEWRLFEEDMTWRDAEQTCQSYGGHLANIEADLDRTRCAKTALQSCFRDGVVTLDRAFVGLTDLFTASDFRWTSNNAGSVFRFGSLGNLGRNQICISYHSENNGLLATNCTARRPFVCQRLTSQAQDPFSTTCSGSVYTYNTVAFSWLEAEQNCSRTGGQLLATAPGVQSNCARQVLALPVFLAGSAVDAINMWVNCSNPPCPGTNQMCPQWNASSGLSSLAPCWLPAPYICVVEIDECVSQPCVNQGTCVDGRSTFYCTCPNGYTGQACETDIDECSATVPFCSNGGTCANAPGSYSCSCAAGFTGANCGVEINECFNIGMPCLNGGSCQDLVNTYSCFCPPGFTGHQCQTDINDCLSDPCGSGGSCTDERNRFTCTCLAGVTGLLCETDLDDCANDPCENMAVCRDMVNGYQCDCLAGYTGTNCQTDIDHCAASPCSAGSTCVDGVTARQCVCKPDYTGPNCDQAIDDCASSPCVAGAACTDGVNTFTCQCPSPEQEQLCDPQAQLLQTLPLTLRNDIIVFELVPASRNWSPVAVYMSATASTPIAETSRAGQFAFLIRSSSTTQLTSQRVLFQNYTSVLANYTMFAVDLGASSVVAVEVGSGNTIVNLESLTAAPTVMQISVQYRTFNLDCYAVSPCPEWQEAPPGTPTSSFLIPSTQPQSLEVRLVVQYSDTSSTARRKRQASATSETTVPFSLRSPGSRSATTTTFTPPVTSVPGTVDAAGQTSGSDSTGAIVGVVVGLLVGILVAVAIVLLARRRKQKKQEADDSVLSSPVFVNQTSTNRTNGGSSSNRSTRTNGSHGQGQPAGAITDDTYEEVAQRARAKEAAIEMVDLVHGYENPAYGEDQAKRNTLISQYSEADQHCGGITNAIYEALDCEPKDSTLRSNASAEHEGVSYALYETAEDAKGGSRVPVPRETSMYENGGMCTGEGDGKGGDGVDDIVYESADPQYFTLERDEHTESSREARLLSQSSNKRYDEAPRLYGGAGAAAAGSSSTWSRSTGGSHTSSSSNTYDDVVAIMRNSLPYRAPPNKESEVYSTLRHKIYVHLKRTDLHIEHQIGQGHFGQVMRAKWRRSDGVRVPVAVKMLRDDCNSENRISFLKEAIVMGQFFHQNVVTMYGVVDDTDPYIIVLELMRTALRPHLYALSDRDRSVPSAMLGYAIDIANGMEYLARRDFVHRDLAARNILLDEKMTCKIADFGMSRNLEDGDYYISHSTGPIPVKWTAPEALSYSRYSTASDVWSFGIVLYEIFSFGRKPFQGVKNEDVLARIDGGYRPEQPEHCPIAVYELQLLCWNGDADERPSFAEIRKRLQQIRKD